MKLFELNNLLHKVKEQNDFFELQSDEDIATVHFVRGRFLFVLNGVGLFDQLRFRTFRDKCIQQIRNRNLKLVE